MTIHNAHDKPWQDDCPRCQEWADNPFVCLDARNLMELYDLTVEFIHVGYIPDRVENGITDTHFRAVRVMEQHIINQRKIDEAMGLAMSVIANGSQED